MKKDHSNQLQFCFGLATHGFVLAELLMSIGISGILAVAFFQILSMVQKEDIYSRAKYDFDSSTFFVKETLSKNYNCFDYLVNEPLNTPSGVKLISNANNSVLVQEGLLSGFQVNKIHITTGAAVGEAEKATLEIEGGPISPVSTGPVYSRKILLLITRSPDTTKIADCAVAGSSIASCLSYAGLACTPELGTAGISSLFCSFGVSGTNFCLYPADSAAIDAAY